jgi:hypothetical protein
MSVLKDVLEHAKRHVEYPTSKKALVEACNNFADIPREEKEWFEKNLPERGYNEPVEVIKALLDKV